jgi:hypothetical protein
LICSRFNNADSFKDVVSTFDRICMIKDEDFPLVVIVRTACDKDEPFTDMQKVLEFVKRKNACFVSSSALLNINVEIPFHLAASAVLKSRERAKPIRHD